MSPTWGLSMISSHLCPDLSPTKRHKSHKLDAQIGGPKYNYENTNIRSEAIFCPRCPFIYVPEIASGVQLFAVLFFRVITFTTFSTPASAIVSQQKSSVVFERGNYY